jgi:hypothetical protein
METLSKQEIKNEIKQLISKNAFDEDQTENNKFDLNFDNQITFDFIEEYSDIDSMLESINDYTPFYSTHHLNECFINESVRFYTEDMGEEVENEEDILEATQCYYAELESAYIYSECKHVCMIVLSFINAYQSITNDNSDYIKDLKLKISDFVNDCFYVDISNEIKNDLISRVVKNKINIF